MIDAPVSGGVPAASNATLTFIVGGTKEGLEISRPLLMSMGANIVHCGEAGDGCIAKVRSTSLEGMTCHCFFAYAPSALITLRETLPSMFTGLYSTRNV